MTGGPLPAPTQCICAAGIPQNLAIKFKDDGIDETDALANMLERDSAVAATLNLTVLSLPGDHIRPCRQEVRAPQSEPEGSGLGFQCFQTLTIDSSS